MAKQVGKLKQLPVNKTVVFWSPLEGEDVLVRTGTISEGSCFFHALLHAYHKDYASMSRKERMKYVRHLRASMAGNIDRENWEEIGEGLIAKVPFQEKIIYILANFYRFLDNNDYTSVRGSSTRRLVKKILNEEKENLEVLKLIKELIPLDTGFKEKILPSAYISSENGSISECCDAIIEESIYFLKKRKEIKIIDKKKSEYICNATDKFLRDLLKEAENTAFKEYIKGLEHVGDDIDTYTIDSISNRFNRDIYFLDGKNRMPYNNSSTTENLKKRKAIILLWIGGNHYEVVGRLLPGNRIQREFSADDPIINKIYTFLVNPDEVHECFSELVPYLPKMYKDNSPSHRRCSDSDNSDNSDSNNSDSDNSDSNNSDSNNSDSNSKINTGKYKSENDNRLSDYYDSESVNASNSD